MSLQRKGHEIAIRTPFTVPSLDYVLLTIMGSTACSFSQRAEVDGAGKRSHHDKLREGDAGLDRHFDRGGEGCGPIGGQAEDERTEDVHAVLLEGLELFGEGLAGVVPVLIDGLQSLRA